MGEEDRSPSHEEGLQFLSFYPDEGFSKYISEVVIIGDFLHGKITISYLVVEMVPCQGYVFCAGFKIGFRCGQNDAGMWMG
jgi:hypothetical protein